MPTVVEYASRLIEFESVSHLSNVAVTDQVQHWLEGFGFECERLEYDDANGIRKANVIGKLGSGTGGLGYFGHTDVVPAADWAITEHGPFEPRAKEGKLYGRGSTDMKGSVACMLAAIEGLAGKTLSQPLYFCCTADEEVGMCGAAQIAEESHLFQEMVAAQTPAIIGEPTELQVVHGHKGGCAFKITSHGRAAHSSTRNGINANWKMIPFLSEMQQIHHELESEPRWQNNEFDPPTMTMNLGINDHMHAINVTPPQSVCTFYFRPPPGIDVTSIITRIQHAAAENGLTCEMRMQSPPMYVPKDAEFIQRCLTFATHPEPKTVAYGTDASRFGALKKMVVMGPGSIAQAHTHDEWVSLDQLEQGTQTYARMIEAWCGA